MNGAAGPDGRRLGVLGRHLDVEAQHGVVPDFQALDAGFGDVARLQLGDQPPALVAQAAQLVQLRPVALGDEAAVANRERQIRGQRCVQQRDEFAVLAQVLRRSGDAGRRRAAQAGVGGESTQVRRRSRARRGSPRDRAGRRGRARAAPARAPGPDSASEASRTAARSRSSSTNTPTMSSRRSMRIGSVSGADSRASSSRAPAPVTVRSTTPMQAALALAGERAGQLQVAAGGARRSP